MVCFSTPDDGRHDRLYLIKFNAEHSERYWLQSFEATSESHLIMLIDCRDLVGRAIAERLGGKDRVAEMLRDCRERDNIPTLHAAVPIGSAVAVLSQMLPNFVPGVVACPDDAFCVWCVAAGGSSLAYRRRPSITAECSMGDDAI